MIRRISATGEDEQLAQLYYQVYRKKCADHVERYDGTVVYLCHSEYSHGQFSGLLRELGIKLIDAKNVTPPWDLIAEAILEDEELSHGKPFTGTDIKDLTGLPHPHRALNHLVAQGFLETSGKNRGHKYRLARSKRKGHDLSP